MGKEADELDKSARLEAQHLLIPDQETPGRSKFDFAGFLALSRRSTPYFAGRVLSYLPLSMLSSIQEMAEDANPACLNGSIPWTKLLLPHVTNESLLRDLLQRRRLWAREFGENECLPKSKLISMFDTSGTAPKKIFRRKRLELALATMHPKFQRGLPANPIGEVPVGSRSVVPCIDLFRICFDVFTNGMFRGVKFDGKLMIAGGTVFACMLPLPMEISRIYKRYLEYGRAVRQSLSMLPSDVIAQVLDFWGNPVEARLRAALHEHYASEQSPFHASDVDVFLVAKNFEEAECKIRELYDKITANIPKPTCVVKTANTITICSEFPYRHVQIVVSVCRSIEEHLISSDLDCVSSAYDGSNVYVLPRTIRAMNYRYNFVEPVSLIHQLANSDQPRLCCNSRKRLREFTNTRDGGFRRFCTSYASTLRDVTLYQIGGWQRYQSSYLQRWRIKKRP